MHADRSLVLPSADEVDLAVEVFRMLSDGTRLTLLWCLVENEMSVGELAVAVGRSAAAVSQHLAKLRLARLVQTRRAGNTIFYRLENDHARQLVLDGIHHAEHQGTVLPAHHRVDADVSVLPRSNNS
ncbi:transcriptional regulator [Aeromicrobium sp. A1-2]|uniref:ArsR/SmtB family transcription factor n=1 Tax=Aeromicrobium sp. A1-2 TaxID=2107713 RepID=UPI000E48006F|nr:metalloregulator ArsR/SmtB family transcription factor [Aeromicrobium sp. A1-2]AXT86725.1 transcriptional regulator [Aeromicrobium sp. A1-2]